MIAYRLFRWLETVEDYSGRAFTRSSDRLPALSGLATELEMVLKCEYVAGLWRSGLLMGLLWVSDHTRKPRNTELTNCYQAPSWSWASIPNPVTYKSVHAAFDNNEGYSSHLAAHVMEIHLVPDGIDPKGRLAGGFIRLRGRVRWVKGVPQTMLGSYVTALDEEPVENGALIYPSDQDNRQFFIKDSYFTQGEIQCPMLAVRIITSKRNGAFALVLLPTGTAENEFRRIGLIERISDDWFNRGWDMELTII
jgi:hypothetical protein